MANYQTLKTAIQQVVKTNGNNEITGALMQQTLLSMVNSLGAGYQFTGIATPTTNPGTPDQKVFYIAGEGEYQNFSLKVFPGELAVFKYGNAWEKESFYDPLNIPLTIQGYLHRYTGLLQETPYWRASDFVPVRPGQKFETFGRFRGAYNLYVAFYDKNKEFYYNSPASTDSGDFETKQIIIPNGVYYARFNTQNDTNSYARNIGEEIDLNAILSQITIENNERSRALTQLRIFEDNVNLCNELFYDNVAKLLGVNVIVLDASFDTQRLTGYTQSGTKLLFKVISGVGVVGFYGFKRDGSYDDLAYVFPGEESAVTLSQDYAYINIYASTVHHIVVELAQGDAIMTQMAKDVANKMSKIYVSNLRDNHSQFSFPPSQTYQLCDINVDINNGDWYYFDTNYGENYIMYTDGSYAAISAKHWAKLTIPTGKTIARFRSIIPSHDQPIDVNIGVIVMPELWGNAVNYLIDEKVPQPSVDSPMRILVLGDSYSQNGGAWIQPMMENLPTGSSYISLAVSSASLKDHYADRVTYPYTSRPVSSDNTGNHNTLACQIQKLKRLMAGTDLDAGETKIYTNPNEYPNVIIIEGGKNDYYDSAEKVATYTQQLNKEITNVYRIRQSGETPELGSVTIKTPIEEIDRTCFAGAYRYLMDELLALFPNAQIYFTTISPISYRNGNNVSEISLKIVEQQRLCADILTANLIDWYRDGQINSIANYARGTGTQADPYIWGQQTGSNIDTDDQLHPNGRGGKKYGKLAALRIKQTFLNIENF